MDIKTYTIHVCDRCGTAGVRHSWAATELIRRPASRQTPISFRLTPVRCMGGCGQPLVVGFSAPNKASYLFGGIDPVRDAEALLTFGELYSHLHDGWCNEGARPAGLHGKLIARIPFAEGRAL